MKHYCGVLLAVAFSPGLVRAQGAAPSRPVTEEVCGQSIVDPYRNLEDLGDASVQAWMKSQAEHARAQLDGIPGRNALIAKMKEFDVRRPSRVARISITENDRYFYVKSRPEDQQPKLYWRQGYRGAESLLFDPEAFEKGKSYTINAYSTSQDGSKVSLVISDKGSELGYLLIMNVDTKSLSPERLDRARDAGAWMPDGNSLVYAPLNNADIRSMEARLSTTALLHRIGTPQSQDQPTFSAKLYPALGIRPEEYPYVRYDKDAKLIYGEAYTVSPDLRVYYAPAAELGKQTIDWKPLFERDREVRRFSADAKYMYFITTKGAPRLKLMRMPLAALDLDRAETLVDESPDETLKEFVVNADGVYFTRTRNGVESFLYFLRHGGTAPERIKLPSAAGQAALSVKDVKTSDLWVSLTGWTLEDKRYRYDRAKRAFTPEPLSSEATYPEFKRVVVEEVMVASHDGVEIPVSLIYEKGLKKNGSNPTLIYGYGAYGISIPPAFRPAFLLWAHHGGILAVAHVRGGGELGDAWRRGGQKGTKPNTWKDLIATAEWMVKKRLTSPQRIAINGGSAGGILVGRAMTERPDLFAAAIPEVGCLNALRMESSPNGPVNAPEFGTIKNPEECKALIAMDSYLHIQEGGKYPATLVTSGMNDPRVIAWQPAKFAARLQASNASTKPILFFTDYDAGHGIGNARQKQFEHLADMMAFAFWQTGHPDFQPVTASKTK